MTGKAKKNNGRHQPYQLLPELSPEEFEALKADIAKRGVQVPVDRDEHGEVLDGHHRVRACDELGIKNYPVRVISGFTEEQKRHHVLSLNLNRRHLTAVQKRTLVDAELRQSPGFSDRLLAKLTGVDHKTVGTLRRQLQARGEIPHVKELRGEDGKSYPTRGVIVHSAREAERAQDALKELGDAAPVKPLSLQRTEELVRIQRWEKAAETKAKVSLKGIELLHCDFRKMKLKPKSVRLILTDPLYQQQHLDLWDDLGKFAKRVLTPDGLLLAYSGIAHLPDVMQRLGPHLKFHWLNALVRNGHRPLHHERSASNIWRPLLVYTNGKYANHRYLVDVFFSNGEQKDFHEWQQDVTEAMHFIGMFTKAGDLVCDPFGGSFTTAVACYRLGRKFIGCDIEEGCVARGNARLAGDAGAK